MRRLLIIALCAATLVSCGSKPEGGSPATGAGSPAASPAATVASPASPATSTAAYTPIGGAHVEQGGRYWAVYLAVGDYDSPDVLDASSRLARLGIESFPGDLSCDGGAAEALGAPEGAAAVGVYFETEEEARAFAATLDPPPVGIAQVTTYCAD